MPLIGFFSSRSCLYSWNAWLMLRSRASSRWGTWMATTIAPTTARVAGVAHRHHGLDHVAVVELVDGGDLLPAERLLHVLAVGLRVGDLGQHRVLDVHELLPVAVEDGDRGHAAAGPAAREVAGQGLALALGEQAVALDHLRHVAAVAERGVLEPLVVGLGHLHRLVERAARPGA